MERTDATQNFCAPPQNFLDVTSPMVEIPHFCIAHKARKEGVAARKHFAPKNHLKREEHGVIDCGLFPDGITRVDEDALGRKNKSLTDKTQRQILKITEETPGRY